MAKEIIDIDLSGIIAPKRGEPKYDIRKVFEYCKEHGIDLSRNEGAPQYVLDMFQIGTY